MVKEPLRSKSLGLGPDGGVVVYRKGRDENVHSWFSIVFASKFSSSKSSGQPTFGNEKSVLLPVFDTGAVRSKKRGEDPQGLLDARLQVRHLPDALLVDISLAALHHPVHLVKFSL